MLASLSKATGFHYAGFSLLLAFLSVYLTLDLPLAPAAHSAVYRSLRSAAVLTTAWIGNRVGSRFGDGKTETAYFFVPFTLLLLCFPFSISNWRIVAAAALLNIAFLGLITQPIHPLKRLFWVGLLLGCATLLYMPFVVFVALIYGALSIFSIPYWKYWVIPAIGLAVPLVYAYSCVYLFSLGSIGSAIRSFNYGVAMPLHFYHKVALIVFLLILIYTIFRYAQKPAELSAFQQLEFQLALIYWEVGSVLLPFLFQAEKGLIFVLFSPSALLVTAGFAKRFKKWEREIIFWILLSTALYCLLAS